MDSFLFLVDRFFRRTSQLVAPILPPIPHPESSRPAPCPSTTSGHASRTRPFCRSILPASSLGKRSSMPSSRRAGAVFLCLRCSGRWSRRFWAGPWAVRRPSGGDVRAFGHTHTHSLSLSLSLRSLGILFKRFDSSLLNVVSPFRRSARRSGGRSPQEAPTLEGFFKMPRSGVLSKTVDRGWLLGVSSLGGGACWISAPGRWLRTGSP